MGRAIVYAVMGLITIGLLLGFGLTVKLLVLTFMGRRKKNEKVPSPHHSDCACRLCWGRGPERMH